MCKNDDAHNMGLHVKMQFVSVPESHDFYRWHILDLFNMPDYGANTYRKLLSLVSLCMFKKINVYKCYFYHSHSMSRNTAPRAVRAPCCE